MKVGIERNKMKVELIRFLDIIDSIDVDFFEAGNSMQYRSPNATQDSCSQQCILSSLGVTVVHAMGGHPWDQAKVSAHDRWPLIRGTVWVGLRHAQQHYAAPPEIYIVNTCTDVLCMV